MENIRVGKTIIMKWKVTTNGENRTLTGRNLQLVLSNNRGKSMILDYTVEEPNTIVTCYQGKDNTSIGAYTLTLWENRGKGRQSAVDTEAFIIVRRTFDECDCCCQEGLDTETIILQDANIDVIMGIFGSMSYNDLSNKPTADDINYDATKQTHATGSVGAQIKALVDGKQNNITDLDTIRSGAALGATALQTHQDISGKVDKETGKGLSANNYTDADKAKVDELSLVGGKLEIGSSLKVQGDIEDDDNNKLSTVAGQVTELTQKVGEFDEAIESAVYSEPSVISVEELKSDSLSAYGCVANDANSAKDNGIAFGKLIESGDTIIVKNEYYVALDGIVEVDHPVRIIGGGCIRWVKNGISYLKPKEGFSFVAEDVSFYNISSNSYGWLNGKDIDFVIDEIRFSHCKIYGVVRAVTLSFADLDLTNTIGISKLTIENCYTENNSRVFTIGNCDFIDRCEISGNTFYNFREAPIYFAADNAGTYTDARGELSCDVHIHDNVFYCDAPINNDVIYHCSVVAEVNAIIFENNVIDGVSSYYKDGKSPSTCYDAYLSCKRVVYKNNLIRNVFAWRTDGTARGSSILFEYFKSKGTCHYKEISNNSVLVEKSYLDNWEVPSQDRNVNIFVYQHPQDILIFKNNILRLEDVELVGRSAINSGVIGKFYFEGNKLMAKKISQLITNGKEGAKVINVIGNTFDVEEGNNLLLYFPTDSDFDEVVVKDNVSNRMFSMKTSPSAINAQHFYWEEVSHEDGNANDIFGVGKSDAKVRIKCKQNGGNNISVYPNKDGYNDIVYDIDGFPKYMYIKHSSSLVGKFVIKTTTTKDGVANVTKMEVYYVDGVLTYKFNDGEETTYDSTKLLGTINGVKHRIYPDEYRLDRGTLDIDKYTTIIVDIKHYY